MLFHFIIMKRISGVNGHWLSLSHIFRFLNPCSRDSSIFSLWSTWYIFHPLHNINVGASRGYRRCIQKALNSRRQKTFKGGGDFGLETLKFIGKKAKCVMSNLGDGKNATCAAKICRGMRHVCMMTVSLKDISRELRFHCTESSL